ncbi:PYCR1 [Cordylochernes scorpioides]|uniref:Pyrroline-5-carboxylate reductase n=1 Tax=Cordylochernes scorpioides TaxID=51811 RepID=A0ABY6LNU3_9ARAC|nr:PYCR1 [Cordylochernes scorpioides]
MAQAIAFGILNSGLLKPSKIYASAPTNTNLRKFQDRGCSVTTVNKDVVDNCKAIFLCVKPHLVESVLRSLNSWLSHDHLIISVAAGISLTQLEKIMEYGDPRVVRTMPNTPSMVKAGACGFVCGSRATREDAALVRRLFSTIGICEELQSESLIDAVSGLSGSGPAYIYTAIQAMADGGVKMGLPRKLALRLAAQTALGAGQMVLQTEKHPIELRDEVCSPGGTTIAAVHALEGRAVHAAFMEAVEASANRCKKLTQ